jgi:hypothetical protein
MLKNNKKQKIEVNNEEETIVEDASLNNEKEEQ